MLKKVVKFILSTFYYDLRLFFTEIFRQQKEFQFIVFLTRRCSNLADIFYQLYQKPSPEGRAEASFPANFLTDSALLSLDQELALFYRKYGRFPSILIVDDLVIYGRSLNQFLKDLENALYKRLRGDGISYEEISTALLWAVQIRSFARSDQPLLLFSRYLPNFSTASVMPPYQWHDLSNRISQLIRISGVLNSSFIGGAVTDLDDGKFAKLQAKGFRRIDTTYDTFPQTVFYRECTMSDKVHAIYTVRLFRSAAARKIVAAPFVFLPALEKKKMDRMIRHTMKLLRCELGHTPFEHGGSWEKCSRIRGEAFCLVLSTSLLTEFCERCNVVFRFNCENKLQMNYATGLLPDTDYFIRSVLDPSQHLLSLSQMDQIFMDYVFPAAIQSRGNTSAKAPVELQELLENVIYEIGQKQNRRAFRQTQVYFPHGLPGDDAGQEMTVTDLLHRTLKNVYAYELPQLISCLLQMLDAGILSITIRSKTCDGRHYDVQCVKTGEQSHFIMPKRLQEFLPVLLMIQRKSDALLTEFDDELEKLARVNPEIRKNKKCLLRFVRGLEETGQTLEDWDLSLLNRTIALDSKAASMEQTRKSLDILRRQKQYMDDYMNLLT